MRCCRCGRDLYATVAFPPPPPIALPARRRPQVHPLAVAGSLGILVSAFLPWISSNGSQSGFEVPLAILWNLSADPEGPKLGFALFALGAGGLACVRPRGRSARVLGS
jgi:hypothetical protein